MSWAGMRGVVSLAAALSLPAAFPGRDVILATPFLVILLTVLIQGSILAPLIRLLRLSDFSLKEPDTLTVDQARALMAKPQLETVEHRAAGARLKSIRGSWNNTPTEHGRVRIRRSGGNPQRGPHATFQHRPRRDGCWAGSSPTPAPEGPHA